MTIEERITLVLNPRTKTEELFSKEPDEYPERVPFAEKRIADGRSFMVKVRELARHELSINGESERYMKLEKKYEKIEKAVKFWRKILNEGNEL